MSRLDDRSVVEEITADDNVVVVDDEMITATETQGSVADVDVKTDAPDSGRHLRIYMDEDELLGLHRRLASKLFRLVRKRGGTIVPFDRTKITTAIFKAAEEVGGRDIEVAERLTDEVLLFLYSEKGDKLPQVEEIQNAIEKILVERGHAKTAKAFILYRDRRHFSILNNLDVNEINSSRFWMSII
ncbi:hypothetical protein K8S17_03590, partial [bacterium]|nr:hypothetical protein [bacterium]